MTMLMRHLSYFDTLAKERHFAGAAEACHVAQPTLPCRLRFASWRNISGRLWWCAVIASSA